VIDKADFYEFNDDSATESSFGSAFAYSYPMSTENQDWQLLAQQASEEQDPERLMELVRQLNSALDNANTRSSTPDADSGEAVESP
jgi:hypothetical protein